MSMKNKIRIHNEKVPQVDTVNKVLFIEVNFPDLDAHRGHMKTYAIPVNYETDTKVEIVQRILDKRAEDEAQITADNTIGIGVMDKIAEQWPECMVKQELKEEP